MPAAGDSLEAPPRRRLLSGLLTTGAGVLGACGVALSAAAVHRDGGQLASTAGLFCLLHAAAILALARPVWRGEPPQRRALLSQGAGLVLLLGTGLFSADLAMAGLAAWHPLPLMAPLGGTAMIVGWLLVVLAGLGEVLCAR